MLYRMPSWELSIAAERMHRHQAQRDLMGLTITTFPDWVGEMPKTQPKTQEDRQRQRAYDEGARMRREFREKLVRVAYGQAVTQIDGAGELLLNEHGETVDSTGRIYARNAAHIKQIISRVIGAGV